MEISSRIEISGQLIGGGEVLDAPQIQLVPTEQANSPYRWEVPRISEMVERHSSIPSVERHASPDLEAAKRVPGTVKAMVGSYPILSKMAPCTAG